MTLTDTIEEVLETDGSIGLDPADREYLKIRQVIEPGLINDGFDTTPAKSRAYDYTDQTHRNHILNGMAFAARFNHALRQIGSDEQLTAEEYRQVCALFTVHDLHKTPEAQERRWDARGRSDADKDVDTEELADHVRELGLDQLEIPLSINDYHAAALGAEERSGRHRGATSRTFTRFRPWIRLMDAAAAVDSPDAASNLGRRVGDITSDVSLDYHRADDVRGITTNFLNSAVSDLVSDRTDAIPVVYFQNGVIYAHPSSRSLDHEVIGGEDAVDELTDSFFNTLQENVDEFSDSGDVRNSLVEKLNYGFMEFTRSTYLLYGFDRAEEALREDIVDRMSRASLYSQYELGATVTHAADLADTLPNDPFDGQGLTVYLATIFLELFEPLAGGDSDTALRHMSEALEVPDAAEFITSLNNWTYTPDTASVGDLSEIASHLDTSSETLSEELEGNIKLRVVKRFATVLALMYLDSEDTDADPGRPLVANLDAASSRLKKAFYGWNDDWDDHRGRDWDDSTDREEKPDQFLQERTGTARDAVRHYIGTNLSLFGSSLQAEQTDKTKLDQFARSSQPHICLMCNSVLVGSGSKGDFEVSGDVAGFSMRFSHLNEIDAEGGEPDGVMCPICELEMVLRNSVHSQSDSDAQYMFAVPDYFYAPGDVAYHKTIRDRLYASGGYTLFQMAQRIVSGEPESKAGTVSEVLETLSPNISDDGEAGESGSVDEFRNFLKNYDAPFDDEGSLGIFRLDAPTRGNGSNDPVTRVPHWLLSVAAGVVFGWITSSRVLVSDRPIPLERFDEFDDMVRITGAPPKVRNIVGEHASVSYLHDLNHEPSAYEIPLLFSESEPDDPSATGEGPDCEEADEREQSTGSSVSIKRLRIETEMELLLQKMASLLSVTFRRHGAEAQRLATVADAVEEPFPGARTLLKGGDPVEDYSGLNAANVLDTLTTGPMNNSIRQLAEAGFDTVRPDYESSSNHENERLFREARDAITDDLVENSDRDELVDIVAGVVMKAAARTERNSDFANEDAKREAAQEFADVFVNDIFYSMCNGDFYELRRHENSLAAGYNAAIRRRQHESFEEATDTGGTDEELTTDTTQNE